MMIKQFLLTFAWFDFISSSFKSQRKYVFNFCINIQQMIVNYISRHFFYPESNQKQLSSICYSQVETYLFGRCHRQEKKDSNLRLHRYSLVT